MQKYITVIATLFVFGCVTPKPFKVSSDNINKAAKTIEDKAKTITTEADKGAKTTKEPESKQSFVRISDTSKDIAVAAQSIPAEVKNLDTTDWKGKYEEEHRQHISDENNSHSLLYTICVIVCVFGGGLVGAFAIKFGSVWLGTLAGGFFLSGVTTVIYQRINDLPNWFYMIVSLIVVLSTLVVTGLKLWKQHTECKIANQVVAGVEEFKKNIAPDIKETLGGYLKDATDKAIRPAIEKISLCRFVRKMT
jgi:hypothetical protein